MKARDAVFVLLCTVLVAVFAYIIGVRDGREDNDQGPADTYGEPPAPDADTGESSVLKVGKGPVPKLHQFYGPLDPHAEDDPGWNCLTQGGRSC